MNANADLHVVTQELRDLVHTKISEGLEGQPLQDAIERFIIDNSTSLATRFATWGASTILAGRRSAEKRAVENEVRKLHITPPNPERVRAMAVHSAEARDRVSSHTVEMILAMPVYGRSDLRLGNATRPQLRASITEGRKIIATTQRRLDMLELVANHLPDDFTSVRNGVTADDLIEAMKKTQQEGETPVAAVA